MSAPGTWPTLIRQALEDERELGVTSFPDAWARAIERHPIPAMFLPPFRATLFVLPGDEEEESVSEFTYRVMEREWLGKVAPGQRLLGNEVEAGWVGAFARRSPRRGGAQ